jgi:hypothetical protein
MTRWERTNDPTAASLLNHLLGRALIREKHAVEVNLPQPIYVFKRRCHARV